MVGFAGDGRGAGGPGGGGGGGFAARGCGGAVGCYDGWEDEGGFGVTGEPASNVVISDPSRSYARRRGRTNPIFVYPVPLSITRGGSRAMMIDETIELTTSPPPMDLLYSIPRPIATRPRHQDSSAVGAHPPGSRYSSVSQAIRTQPSSFILILLHSPFATQNRQRCNDTNLPRIHMTVLSRTSRRGNRIPTRRVQEMVRSSHHRQAGNLMTWIDRYNPGPQSPPSTSPLSSSVFGMMFMVVSFA